MDREHIEHLCNRGIFAYTSRCSRYHPFPKLWRIWTPSIRETLASQVRRGSLQHSLTLSRFSASSRSQAKPSLTVNNPIIEAEVLTRLNIKHADRKRLYHDDALAGWQESIYLRGHSRQQNHGCIYMSPASATALSSDDWITTSAQNDKCDIVSSVTKSSFSFGLNIF